jgi:hypothetical protein
VELKQRSARVRARVQHGEKLTIEQLAEATGLPLWFAKEALTSTGELRSFYRQAAWPRTDFLFIYIF